MTKEDVIRMAREAGFLANGQSERAWLERFAAKVAASEREECARLAGSHSSDPWRHDAGAMHICDMVSTSIAKAIRARNNQ